VTITTHADYFSKSLADADPDVFNGIQGELGRQQEPDRADRLGEHRLQGGAGGPGLDPDQQVRRGLSGQALLRRLRIRRRDRDDRHRARQGAVRRAFANVQPHSGSQANQAVFMALLQPGDTFLGMDLAAGGHLTHGSPANQSGKWFKPVSYTVRQQDQLIDYDHVAEMAERRSPS
jgi:glycine hydroxymethyltransferase